MARLVARSRARVAGVETTRAPRADGLPAELPGGRALRFYASVRVELKRGDLIREPTSVVGSRIDAVTVKNKLAPLRRTGTLRLTFGEGFHDP